MADKKVINIAVDDKVLNAINHYIKHATVMNRREWITGLMIKELEAQGYPTSFTEQILLREVKNQDDDTT